MAPKPTGFTLSELLIALMILGVIATFTIPKVLQAQQAATSKSIAKEAAGTITAAYAAYRLESQPSASTKPGDLLEYLNYAQMQTTGSVDNVEGQGSFACNTPSHLCLKLHNGATLVLNDDSFFSGTDTTNVILFMLDPDGVDSGLTTGPSKSVWFFLHYNGRLTTYRDLASGSRTAGLVLPDCPECDPDWFSWD